MKSSNRYLRDLESYGNRASYLNGYRDYRSGKGLENNPFTERSKRFDLWNMGYRYAEYVDLEQEDPAK